MRASGESADASPAESSIAEPSSAPLRSTDLDGWVRRMAAEGVSDLHLTEGRRPRWRLDGRLVEIADAGIPGEGSVHAAFEPVLDERRRAEFRDNLDVDFGYSVPGVARLRVNMYREKHGVSAAMRLISNKILTFEQLGLPADLTRFCDQPKGLVLVTGPTGSGKSTTLAAMIDHINRTRPVHVLTIEDPIEFVHANQNALITQREIGSHATGFQRALRAALREDPDVILVGEMRDPETVQLAIEAGNTGHLVFSTLHTSSAATTVDRIVDLFEPSRQEQIRSSLAETLLGVVSQTLCRRVGGGRVAALEVLVVNHAIANLIREGKTSQLVTVMQTGRQEGNRLMSAELAALVKSGVVTREEALAHSTERKELERQLGRPGEMPRREPLGFEAQLFEPAFLASRRLRRASTRFRTMGPSVVGSSTGATAGPRCQPSATTRVRPELRRCGRYVLRLGAREPGDDGGDPARAALRPHRVGDLAHHQVLGQSRERAGRDAVDGDSVALELAGRDDGEGGDAGLGGSIVGLTHVAVDPRHRGGGDEPGVDGIPAFA